MESLDSEELDAEEQEILGAYLEGRLKKIRLSKEEIERFRESARSALGSDSSRQGSPGSLSAR